MKYVDLMFDEYPDVMFVFEIDCDDDNSDMVALSNEVWDSSHLYYRWAMFGLAAEADQFVELFSDRILSEHRRQRPVKTLISMTVQEPRSIDDILRRVRDRAATVRMRGGADASQ